MTEQAGADLDALSDLCTPWCVRVAATLRIADRLAAGAADADVLAAAGCDADSLRRVLLSSIHGAAPTWVKMPAISGMPSPA